MTIKNKTLICTSFSCLALVLGIGLANTASAYELQPAATITYNEDLTVNGTGSFDSIKIGKQGVGGVTFFNGSIINATTGANNYNNPITFADSVRIDGDVFRGELPGSLDDKPFRIMDNLYVYGGISGDGHVRIYDELEVTRDAEFIGAVKIADLQGSGIVKEDNIANGAVTLGKLANNSVSTSKISDGAVSNAKLANNAVNSLKIADGSVANGDLAGGIAASKISGTALTKTATFSGDVNGIYNNLQLGAGTVGTGEIADGTIMNVDINASAAIDPTKINGTAWTSNNDGSSSGLDADTVDGLHASNMVRATGLVAAGAETIIEIPHYTPFEIILSSGWPDVYGLAHVTGFENDHGVGVTSIEYNGDGTSQATGAKCAESTSNELIRFGNGGSEGYLRCPGEMIGAHNLVIGATASGVVEVLYQVIY